MAGERVEVAVEILDVDREVRRGLRAVDDGGRPRGARECDEVAHGVHGAEGVRDMPEGGDAHVARGELTLEILGVEGAGGRDPCGDQGRSRALAGELPGHDVGVVFQFRHQDPVAGPQHGAPVGLGDEVDGFRGAAGPDDLGRGRGVDASRDGLPRRLEGRGRRIAQGVGAAVHVGVGGSVVAAHGVQHGPGFLRGGGVVEVGDVVPAHDQGEVRANRRDVERRGSAGVRCGGGGHAGMPSRARASAPQGSETASARNPAMSRSLARVASTPRERR